MSIRVGEVVVDRISSSAKIHEKAKDQDTKDGQEPADRENEEVGMKVQTSSQEQESL